MGGISPFMESRRLPEFRPAAHKRPRIRDRESEFGPILAMCTPYRNVLRFTPPSNIHHKNPSTYYLNPSAYEIPLGWALSQGGVFPHLLENIMKG